MIGPALPERAGVGSIPANSDAQKLRDKTCLLSAVGDLKSSLVFFLHDRNCSKHKFLTVPVMQRFMIYGPYAIRYFSDILACIQARRVGLG
jgi:hypothetical protein